MPASNDKPFSRVAVDEEAKRYFESYYADSGYGKLWVREIPMRVQAELAKRAAKTASVAASTSIKPLATVLTDQGVHLEGLAVSGTGKGRKATAFVVDFDHQGNVQGFDSIEIA